MVRDLSTNTDMAINYFSGPYHEDREVIHFEEYVWLEACINADVPPEVVKALVRIITKGL